MKLIPPIVVALTAATLFLLERRFPLRRETRVLISRLAVNLAISVLTFLVAWTLVQPAAHAALHRTADKPFGITNVVKMPLTVQFIVSFLLMDLIFYY